MERARAVGFLGPGPLRVHVDHAQRYVEAMPDGLDATRIIDLGSGGGLPGLPLFLSRPSARGTLLDASTKRCAFLLWAVQELHLADRVEVLEGRAEDLAHLPEHRGIYDVVTARGFGPPATTVECALGFLGNRGRIVISEPPERRPWPIDNLALLGLQVGTNHAGVVTFDVVRPPQRTDLPRPLRLQRRDPLFSL